MTRSLHRLQTFTFITMVFIAVAQINSGLNPSLADQPTVKMVHAPLAVRPFTATNAWIREQQAKGANKEVEKAKQQGIKPAV